MGLNVKKCSRCGKLFNYVLGADVCPECKEREEEDYKKVKEYVYDHKGATIPQVAEACEVDKKIIKQWLREDRLQLSDEAVNADLVCEHCGKPITSGRFCPECKVANAHAVKEMTPEKKATVVNRPKVSGPSKMRFFNT